MSASCKSSAGSSLFNKALPSIRSAFRGFRDSVDLKKARDSAEAAAGAARFVYSVSPSASVVEAPSPPPLSPEPFVLPGANAFISINTNDWIFAPGFSAPAANVPAEVCAGDILFLFHAARALRISACGDFILFNTALEGKHHLADMARAAVAQVGGDSVFSFKLRSTIKFLAEESSEWAWSNAGRIILNMDMWAAHIKADLVKLTNSMAEVAASASASGDDDPALTAGIRADTIAELVRKGDMGVELISASKLITEALIMDFSRRIHRLSSYYLMDHGSDEETLRFNTTPLADVQEALSGEFIRYLNLPFGAVAAEVARDVYQIDVRYEEAEAEGTQQHYYQGPILGAFWGFSPASPAAAAVTFSALPHSPSHPPSAGPPSSASAVPAPSPLESVMDYYISDADADAEADREAIGEYWAGGDSAASSEDEDPESEDSDATPEVYAAARILNFEEL